MTGEGNIAVLGATSGIGVRLVGRLQSRGASVLALGRSAERLAKLSVPWRVVDLAAAGGLAAALADASHVVSCLPAGFAPDILAALPDRVERVILTGSTRRFTRFPDRKAEQVAAAEAALRSSGRAGVMLHPTMICGGDQENNVQRVASYVRRFGIVPLPEGGRRLIQPIYVDDVAACLEAALTRTEAVGLPVIVAGPEPLTYRAFVEAIAAAIGRSVRILSLPVSVLQMAAGATRLVPGLPRIEAAEIQRLCEDKAFDIAEMRRRLGVEPISLRAALARIFPVTPSTEGRAAESSIAGR